MSRPSLRSRLAAVVLAACAALASVDPAAADPITVTDITGRSVTLPGPARRIVLGQARQLNALGLIHPDPVGLLAGWGNDFPRQNREAYQLYRAKFPAIDAIPIVGDTATGSFSVEQAVAVDPDLVVLSLSVAGTRRGPGDLVERFEKAGIPVVVVDFFMQPLRDTVPSLRVLGRLIGREEAAENYIRFYERHRRRIAERLEQAPRPSVFMHVHAGGTDCCFSPGKGTLDDFIVAAGGRNIAAGLLPGAAGQLSLEQVLSHDPDIYVATGGTHLAGKGGVVLGLGVSADTARRSFATLLQAPGLGALTAVSSGRAHGLWHLFNDTPMHIVAIERLAKWFHPALFADVDPQATLDEIGRDFSAIPLAGVFWIDAPSPGRP